MTEKVELTSEVNDKEKELITRKRTANMFLDDVVRQVKHGNLPAPFAVLQIKQLQKLFTQTLSELEEMANEELIGTNHFIWGDIRSQEEKDQGQLTIQTVMRSCLCKSI